jgi:glycosyltransferase EpsD
MGACLTRLAARNCGAKVIYTAHGFHFFKGSPLLNWLVFYPIEKYLSKYTDCLVTINEEDYYLANKKFKMQAAVSY